MASEIEKEKHRKHRKYAAKEKRQRSEIAKALLTDPRYRHKKSPLRQEAEEKAFKKYRKLESDEDNDLL